MAPSQLTSQDITKLIARVSMKDRAAFDLLYGATSAKLFGVCLRVLSDKNDAEEALQEVFVKIWMKADRFVIGVLSADERRTTAQRIETDLDFARLVDVWQQRLSPLNASYDEVQPPASLKTALDARLFDHGRSATRNPDLLQSLSFWRGFAAIALAAFLLAVAIPLFQPPTLTPGVRLVASLTGDKTDVRYLAIYDARTSEIGLSHVTGDRATGHDFELWIIKGNDPPISMGVIPVGANVHLAVTPAHRDLIRSGALFAISLEPRGGSSTGQPTGPVASGDLHAM